MDVYKLQASLTLNTEEYEKALKAAVSEAANLTQNLEQLRQASNQTDSAIDKTGDAAGEEAKQAKEAAEQTGKMSQKLEEAGDSADDTAEKLRDVSGRLKNDLAVAAKAGGAAFAATSALIIKSTKDAVENYAQYEQLVGGVETLFKDSAGRVQKYAENAYKTAGLSANAYMETVTSFSASLLQGLNGDTAKAADVADLAIRDMSDNANKMGTAMESIQNAYQGFSKQNYMMLDNLKLGYGGTKAEMERLLADAEKLSGIHYEIGNYADMIEAIHIIQTEMGITGTTAKEASETIEGSANAAKAAWQNLLTGFGRNDADLDKLVDEVIDSVTTLGKNVLPVAERAFTSLMKTATREGAKLAKQIPGFIDEATEHIHQTIADEFGATSDQIFAVETAVKAAAAGFVAYKAALVATDVVEGVVTLTRVIEGATTAQEALNAAGMANPYVLLATAIATATVALKSYIDTQADLIDVAGETYNNLTDGQKALIEASDDLAVSINKDVDAAEKNLKSIDAEVGSMQNMVDELYHLNDAENLSNEQKEKMRVLVDSLNESLPALNLQLDEETGHLKNQRSEIDGLIDSYKKQAMAQAAQENMVQLYKDQFEAEKNLKNVEKERADAKSKYDQLLWKSYQLESEMRKAEGEGTNAGIDRYNALEAELNNVNEQLREQENALGDLNGTYVTASEALNTVNGDLETMGDVAASASGETDLLADNTEQNTERITTAMSAQQKTAKALANDLKDYVVSVGGETYNISAETLEDIRDIESAYAEALQSQENNIRGSLDLFSEFNGGAETSAQQLKDNLNSNVQELENWASNIQQLADWGINEGLLAELEKAGPASASKVKAMVDMGEPELKKYSTKWEETQQKIHEIAEQQTDDVKTEAEKSIAGLLSVATDKEDDVKKAYADIGQMLINGIGDEVEGGTNEYIVPVTAEMVHKMNTAAQTALNEANFNEKGDNIPHGLAIGIENGEHWAIDAMHKMIHDVQDTYMQDTDSHSPSKLFKKLAEYIPEGMAEGIKDGEGKVVGAMDELVDAAEKAFKIEPDNNRFKAPDKGFIIDPNTYKFKTPDKNKMIIDPENRRFRFEPYDGGNKRNEFLPSSGKTEDSFSGGDSLSPRSKNNNNKSRSSRRGDSGYYSGYSIERPLTINLVLRNGEAFARFVAPYLDLINAESVTLQQGGAAW